MIMTTLVSKAIMTTYYKKSKFSQVFEIIQPINYSYYNQNMKSLKCKCDFFVFLKKKKLYKHKI